MNQLKKVNFINTIDTKDLLIIMQKLMTLKRII